MVVQGRPSIPMSCGPVNRCSCSYCVGCVLCRGESKSLWEKKAEFEKLNMRMVCLLHEALPAEIKDFYPEFW